MNTLFHVHRQRGLAGRQAGLTAGAASGYTAPVTSKKGVTGFGRPLQFRGKSRMEPHRSAALSICVSSFGGSMGGPRGPAGFREVARSSNPSSRRPHLDVRAPVVANRNPGGHMAHPTQRTRSAKPSATIIPFNRARQRRDAPGQSQGVDMLDALESAVGIYAEALRAMIAEARTQGGKQ